MTTERFHCHFSSKWGVITEKKREYPVSKKLRTRQLFSGASTFYRFCTEQIKKEKLSFLVTESTNKKIISEVHLFINFLNSFWILFFFWGVQITFLWPDFLRGGGEEILFSLSVLIKFCYLSWKGTKDQATKMPRHSARIISVELYILVEHSFHFFSSRISENFENRSWKIATGRFGWVFLGLTAEGALIYSWCHLVFDFLWGASLIVLKKIQKNSY